MIPRFQPTDEAAKLVGSLEKSTKEFASFKDRVTRHIAESYAKDVKRVILSQAFSNVQLSPGWIARKARERKDPRTLIATKRYYDSIKAEQVKKGEWSVVCSDDQLRRRLEQGTRTSPPRRHWGPVLDLYSRRFHDLFGEEFLSMLGGK